MFPIASFADDFGPILALIVVFMLPIVAILSRHQLKMAMIMRQPHEGSDQALMQLAAEVRELRSMIAQQSIALDSLRDENRALRASNERSVSA